MSGRWRLQNWVPEVLSPTGSSLLHASLVRAPSEKTKPR